MVFVTAAGFNRAAEEGTVAEVVVKAQAAFVFVAGGSGVVISPEGEMVTNSHVIGDADTLEVTLGNGQTGRAEVMGRDRVGDLALLKITGIGAPLAYLRLGVSADLRRGDKCYTVGNPQALGGDGQAASFSAGVISALHQFRQGYNDAIVIDAAVNPGNSGGPLVNARGELVGICGMTQTRLGMKSNTGVAFAIPVDQLKLWLPFLRRARGGNVFHGRLQGVRFADDDGRTRVREVIPQSAGEAAGFRVGDTLVSFMGYHVPTAARFDSISGIYPAGSAMRAVVARQGTDGKTSEKNLRFVLPPLRPWKGDFILADARLGDEYPRIGMLKKGSAAEKAGARENDEILAINNLPVKVSGMAQLSGYLANINAGDLIVLQLRRAGAKTQIKFTAE